MEGTRPSLEAYQLGALLERRVLHGVCRLGADRALLLHGSI